MKPDKQRIKHSRDFYRRLFENFYDDVYGYGECPGCVCEDICTVDHVNFDSAAELQCRAVIWAHYVRLTEAELE